MNPRVLVLCVALLVTGCRIVAMGPGGTRTHGQSSGTNRGDAAIAACHADYDDFVARWTPVENRARAEIQATAGLSFYQAFPRLRALYASLTEDSKKLGLFVGASGLHATSEGIAYDVARAIVELQRRTQREYFRFVKPDQFGRGHLRPETDRFRYCVAASRLGTHRSAKNTNSPYWNFFDRIWPDLANENWRAEEAARAALVIVAPTIGQPLGPVTGWGDIVSIQRQGRGARIKLVRRENVIDCYTSDRIKRIKSNGDVEYEGGCAVNRKQHTTSYTAVTIDELPDIVLAPGDQLDYVIERKTQRILQVTKVSRGEKKLGVWSEPLEP